MSLLGNLSLDAIPFHEPILVFTMSVIAIAGLIIAGLITKYKKWGVLWRDWITSVDHKRLGVMYILLALIMLFRGFFLVEYFKVIYSNSNSFLFKNAIDLA